MRSISLNLTALLVTLALVVSACGGSDAASDAVESTTPDAAAETTASDDGASETEADEAADAASVDEASTDEEPEATDAEPATTADDGASHTADVVAAVEALFAILSDDQIATVSYDYGDSTIASNWSNLPACDEGGRAGIAHGDLDDEQVAAVLDVTATALSEQGQDEYLSIILADEVLGGGDGQVWDADCYYMAVYGTPSTTDAWALQFGGHHYARMFTYEAGTVTTTPAFTGVEPSTFEDGGVTYAPLDDERQAVFAILASLTDEQLSVAEIDGAFDGVLLGPGDDDAFPASEGIAGADLTDEQRSLVLAAIDTWVGDTDEAVSDALMAEAEAQLDDTYIAWASSTDAGTAGAYVRIDGPAVWIEFINQNGVGGNEIHHHSVYRDRADDYGTAA